MRLLLIVQTDSRSVDSSNRLDEMDVLAGSDPGKVTGCGLKLAQTLQRVLSMRPNSQSLGRSSRDSARFSRRGSFDVFHVAALTRPMLNRSLFSPSSGLREAFFCSINVETANSLEQHRQGKSPGNPKAAKKKKRELFGEDGTAAAAGITQISHLSAATHT